jgi:hypothetical protein
MSKKHVIANSTLEQLEGNNWGEVANQSHLVTECHRLRRLPLCQFTTENFRILIGQNIGLRFLMPLAVAKLRDDPLAEGDYFPGDLLCSVLRVSPDFWAEDAELRNKVETLAKQAIVLLESDQKTVMRALNEALAVFSKEFADSNDALNARYGRTTRR